MSPLEEMIAQIVVMWAVSDKHAVYIFRFEMTGTM
jgi:hypothetical protein